MDPSQKPRGIEEVNPASFDSEINRSKEPVLVVFWAPWSRPCLVLRPVLEEVAAACAGWVKVMHVNADNHPELSMWYDIQSIPTLLCFVSGHIRARLIGTASKEAILEKLQKIGNPGPNSSAAMHSHE